MFLQHESRSARYGPVENCLSNGVGLLTAFEMDGSSINHQVFQDNDAN